MSKVQFWLVLYFYLMEEEEKERKKKKKSPWGRRVSLGWTCLAGSAVGHSC
jgi:hypothetical protein